MFAQCAHEPNYLFHFETFFSVLQLVVDDDIRVFRSLTIPPTHTLTLDGKT